MVRSNALVEFLQDTVPRKAAIVQYLRTSTDLQRDTFYGNWLFRDESMYVLHHDDKQVSQEWQFSVVNGTS